MGAPLALRTLYPLARRGYLAANKSPFLPTARHRVGASEPAHGGTDPHGRESHLRAHERCGAQLGPTVVLSRRRALPNLARRHKQIVRDAIMQGSIAFRIENIEVFTHGDASTHFDSNLDYAVRLASFIMPARHLL